MTKDELITRLKMELDTMMSWAREVCDDFLDSDPENRTILARDLAEAKEAMSIRAYDTP